MLRSLDVLDERSTTSMSWLALATPANMSFHCRFRSSSAEVLLDVHVCR
jgi:hypothetical protein